MSGYDPATGVYELTPAQAGEWFGRVSYFAGQTFMERIADVLTRKGLEVLSVADSHMLVRARKGAIQTALSGKPATGQERDDVTERRRYTPMYLGHLVKPQLTAKAFNKLLDAAGLVYREGGEWVLTAAGERYGEYVSAPVKALRTSNVLRSIHWDLAVLDVLGLHWPKPAT